MTITITKEFKEKICNCCGRVYRTEADLLNNTSRWRMCEHYNLWFNCSCGSTLIIINSEVHKFEPIHFMSDKAGSVFNLIYTKQEVPYLSTTVMECYGLLSSESSTPVKLASVLRKDPILAAQILEISNNLKVPTGQPINSLEHAIVYIGQKVVSEMVLVAGTKQLNFNTQYFHKDLFWKESFVTGAISESLGIHLNLKNSLDELYLAGTLLNVGKIIGAISLPEQTDNIWRRVNSTNSPHSWSQEETNTKAINHLILGEIAAVCWGLPLSIVEAIFSHHKSANPRPNKGPPTITEIAAFANQLSHILLKQEFRMDQAVFDMYLDRFFQNKKDLQDFLENVRKTNNHLFVS